MTDQETVARFIFLRSQGWSYNRISVELNVSKPTLINWGRQHQFQIQNLRATETEALAERIFKARHERWEALAHDLARVETELAKRKLDDIPTQRLFELVASIRAQIRKEIPDSTFSECSASIPRDEFIHESCNWKA